MYLEIIKPNHQPIIDFEDIEPEDSLPTEEIIKQGKIDFKNVFENLPTGLINEIEKTKNFDFKSVLTAEYYSPIASCFLGLTAHASQFSGLLTNNQADHLAEFISFQTNNRMGFVNAALFEIPNLAYVCLINVRSARRIMSNYPMLFPNEAMTSPLEWIEQLYDDRDASYDTRLGLLSGFPPASVVQYKSRPPLGVAKLEGAGSFHYFGTESEDRFMAKSRQKYDSSGLKVLIAGLK